MKHALSSLCPLLAAFTAAATPVCANTRRTAEAFIVQRLAIYVSNYASQHEGRAPSSWSDIEPDPRRSLTIDQDFRQITPTKRYAFLTQPCRLPPPHEGDLLILTRRPFREDTTDSLFGLRELGRYMIYRADDGTFRTAYVGEEYIQRAFRESQSLLPTPDSEPLRRHELNALLFSIILWTSGAAIVAFLVRRYYRRAQLASEA